MILVTSDNEQFVVDWDVYRHIGIFSPQDGTRWSYIFFIVRWIPDHNLRIDPSNAPSEPVPLANVSSLVLKKILEYLEHHRNDPLPPSDGSDAEDPRKRLVPKLSEWDENFIQVDQEMLFEIILAANFLDIKPLLYVQVDQ